MSAEGDITLASYEAAAGTYRAHSMPAESLSDFLDRVVAAVGVGRHGWSWGAGTGADAKYLEARGLVVTRTDATLAFVEMMRSDGYPARVLDIRRDEFGGPYDAVLADAVLLHLTRDEFADVLRRGAAPWDRGLLAFTLKEGDGDSWSTAKIGLPRFFTYWREPAVRDMIKAAGGSLTRSITSTANRTVAACSRPLGRGEFDDALPPCNRYRPRAAGHCPMPP